MVTGARDWDADTRGHYCVIVTESSRQRVHVRRGFPRPGQPCSSPSWTGAGAPSPRHAELVLVLQSGSCRWQEAARQGPREKRSHVAHMWLRCRAAPGLLGVRLTAEAMSPTPTPRGSTNLCCSSSSWKR